MYRVFRTEPKKDEWAIWWCPSHPYHYQDRVRYKDWQTYTSRQAAHRRAKQLNEERKAEEKALEDSIQEKMKAAV